MNHFDSNANTPIDEAALSSSRTVDETARVEAQLEPASRETSEDRRARINKIGFLVFMGSFMIFMFVQAVFFPSGGTAPT